MRKAVIRNGKKIGEIMIEAEGTKKIVIHKSATADTRSAKELVDKDTLLKSSHQHINDVQKAMHLLSSLVLDSGKKHDYTKIEHIDDFHKDFALIQAGSKDEFKKMVWFSKYHITERHHLNDRIPDDVNLIDVLEFISDCVMAGLGRSGKVSPLSLPPGTLDKAFQNTIKVIQDNTEVK
jgi:hypothetical protein